jgi:hypothetical protein
VRRIKQNSRPLTLVGKRVGSSMIKDEQGEVLEAEQRKENKGKRLHGFGLPTPNRI